MKKKPNIWGRILIVLIIVFLGLYIASVSGYYETKISNEVALTSEEMASFEEDVLEGKEVDINTYIKNNKEDYSNNLTKAGEALSDTVIEFITDGFTGVWNYFKKLFF